MIFNKKMLLAIGIPVYLTGLLGYLLIDYTGSAQHYASVFSGKVAAIYNPDKKLVTNFTPTDLKLRFTLDHQPYFFRLTTKQGTIASIVTADYVYLLPEKTPLAIEWLCWNASTNATINNSEIFEQLLTQAEAYKHTLNHDQTFAVTLGPHRQVFLKQENKKLVLTITNLKDPPQIYLKHADAEAVIFSQEQAPT